MLDLDRIERIGQGIDRNGIVAGIGDVEAVPQMIHNGPAGGGAAILYRSHKRKPALWIIGVDGDFTYRCDVDIKERKDRMLAHPEWLLATDLPFEDGCGQRLRKVLVQRAAGIETEGLQEPAEK